MAATPTPEQIAALFHALRQLFGTCLIGFTLGTTWDFLSNPLPKELPHSHPSLYGVSVLQTFIYFRLYTKDHWFLKSTVIVPLIFMLQNRAYFPTLRSPPCGELSGSSCSRRARLTESGRTLDTLTTIFVAHSLYVYFVLNFGEDPTVNLIIPWYVCIFYLGVYVTDLSSQELRGVCIVRESRILLSFLRPDRLRNSLWLVICLL